jgi:hypothetical protein
MGHTEREAAAGHRHVNELPLGWPNIGTGTMKLSHITAFAFAAIIGTSALGAPAQAGILGNIVSKVGHTVKQSAQGSKLNSAKYAQCVKFYTNNGQTALTGDAQRVRLDTQCQAFARR